VPPTTPKQINVPLGDNSLLQQLQQFVTKEFFQSTGIVIRGDSEVAASVKGSIGMELELQKILG